MRTTEQLGRLFEYELDVLSDDAGIKLADLLGQSVTVSMKLPEDKFRYFNGVVSRFAQVGAVGERAWYHVTLRPWLWFLTRTADCRIFQSMTVPEIIKQLFSEYEFSDIDDQLQGAHRKWVYCVQYRETDYNFISRLMEQEGIYYFFKHEDGKHTIVLGDSYSAHALIPEEQVLFHQPTNTAAIMPDTIQEWYLSQEVQPGKYELTDYNFETPNAEMKVKKAGPFGHQRDDMEIYDYPGEYEITGDGDTYIKSRLEELQAQYEQVRGSGNVAGMYVGGLFGMVEHPRDDQNREYLLTSVSHDMRSNEYESDGDDEATYYCSFSAIPSGQPFRTPRLTPKPLIQGPQTAVVVGPSNEEIYTDKYGCVKVQFYWDREGQRNENSSCWIRVSQIWAGKAWGAIHIPRIGQEVIVEFLEGDPDRPIITGRVYNADQMPPYDLPGNMTQSGLKSRSTKGGAGGNFNEIRMEDKKGSEELYIHAEKNHTNITEADRSEDVGHDRSLHVGHDKSEAIDNNKAITVGVDHTESIGANKKLDVGANHDETIGASKTLSVGVDHTENIGSNMSITIGSNLTETVALNYAETVGVAMELTVGAAMTHTVGAVLAQSVGANKSVDIGVNHSVSVGGNETVSVTGNKTDTISGNRTESITKDKSETVSGGKTISVTKDLKETISGEHSESVTKDYKLSADKVAISANKEITLVTGSSSITMKSDGTIKINGMKITVEATQKIEEKAMEIKSEASTKNEMKGAMVTVEASGINTVKGALVKIN